MTELEKNKLMEQLNKWCDEQDTQFVKYSCKETNGNIRLYRAESSIAKCTYRMNFKELKEFLKDIDLRKLEEIKERQEFHKRIGYDPKTIQKEQDEYLKELNERMGYKGEY